METVLLARFDMALSLAFHIIFASIGITMPLLMAISEWKWLKTKDPDYLRLTKMWAKGTAVFFAVGAVSGTVLSFELGLLFPGFMEKAGSLIGLPFALEGFAFFTEAIFLGIYLYGWDRISPRAHLLCGLVVALSGAASAAFVTTVNAWMNWPRGFSWNGDTFSDINPVVAMLSPFNWHEIPHTLAASYVLTAIAVAGIHARSLLKHPHSTLHRKAFQIALWVTVPFALLQPMIGHLAGQQVARYQPLKFAAMENQLETQRGAPLHVLGIPVPKLLSFLATNRFDGQVQGLKEFPRNDWPNPLVHYCFQIMILVGTALFALAALAVFNRLRRRGWEQEPWYLKLWVYAAPLGLVATETGWIVTEVGRQPWVIYGILRTADAVTHREGLGFSLAFFALTYVVLGTTAFLVLRRHILGALSESSHAH